MASKLDVSLIIPTLGRVDGVARLCEELTNLNPRPAEILVVFQDYEELNQFKLRSFATPVRALFCETKGASPARNFGARRALSSILVFLDDDCEPASREWLEHIVRPLRDSQVVLVTGAVLNWDNVSGIGRRGSKAFRLAPPFLVPWGNPASTKSSWCDTVSGGNFAIRRSSFLSSGGFLESFGSPSLYEETEFSIRATSAKPQTIWFEHRAAVHHIQAISGGMRMEYSHPSEKFVAAQKRILLLSVYGDNLNGKSRVVLHHILRSLLVLFRSIRRRLVLGGNSSG